MSKDQKIQTPAPTHQQQEVISKLLEFHKDPKQRGECFLLSGFAGTGKTFSITRFVGNLSKAKVALTAPTNKAVRVLETMASGSGLSVASKTIHALLGLVVQQKQDKQILKKKRKSSLDDYALVIVDECSMVNQELWQHIKQELAFSNAKVIFVGDPAQLPPVHELESPTFNIPNKVELTEIVRQEAGNPIIELSAAIREKMTTGDTIKVNDFKRKHGDKTGVSLMMGREFEKWFPRAFKSDQYQGDPDAFRVVSWTNRRVLEFNRSIRNMILGRYPEQPFLPGERVITAAPIYTQNEKKFSEIVLNTDIEGTIRRCTQTVHPWFQEDQFVVWETIFRPADGGKEAVAYIPDDGEKMRIANHLNEMANTAKNNHGPWGAFWRLKNAMADLRPCHAITVHRSQGSTFQNVFIDSENILANPNRQEALQCLYVAITRASKNVILNSSVI